MRILAQLTNRAASGEKLFTVLVDPDKYRADQLEVIAQTGNQSRVDYFFVGGSLLTDNKLDETLHILKANSDIPVIIFPGSTMQISAKADGILFLSLISGRNAEMLIGKHVVSAPYIRSMGLEALPTGYMLIDSGRITTALYMSNTTPIPADKPDVAVCTAMAGEMLGLKLIYMDGGSGAQNTVPEKMIAAVKKNVGVPVIVGGGICSPAQALATYKAGADMIVVGNAIEKDPRLVHEIAETRYSGVFQMK